MLALYWRNFIVPYRVPLLAAIGCFLIASAAGLAAPIIIKLFIDDALQRQDAYYLHLIIAVILGLYLLRGLFSFAHTQFMARAGNKMVTELRSTMFQKLHAQDYVFFVNTPSGKIISLFTNDLLLIQQAVTQAIPDAAVETITVLATMVIMFYLNWDLALVTFVAIPFIIFAIGLFNKKIGGAGAVLEHNLEKLTGIVHQSIQSVRIIQSYVREDYEYKKFQQQNRETAAECLNLQRLNAIIISLVEFLVAIGLTVIIWYGGREVINGGLTVGGMFAFLIYIINLPAPVRKISEAINKIRLGCVAWHRIAALEEQPDALTDGTVDPAEVTGRVEFRNVSFSYRPDMGILKNISFTAEPGEVVAVVGPSGAGKSSFANLMLRFYDPLEGNILLDGIDIRTMKIRALRGCIGFIQQEPVLFNTSILENIRYGRPDANFAEVEQAARLANAHDFIMNLSKGYNSLVGELGCSLSGGERQRIALARAIIMQPKILLMDEPTAALDAQAERQVMAAIRNVSAGRTTFIITHRLSTLANSDKVIYMSNGRIAEIGLYQELVQRGGLFAKAVELGEINGHG